MRRLKSLGYACAQIEIKAFVETETIEVYIDSGKQHDFPQIRYDDHIDQYLHPKVLQRFYAFRPGNTFNERLLELSSKRIELAGTVNHSYFLSECENNQLKVTQKVKIGTYRAINAGIGASTEEFPILKLGWRNTCIGQNGSSLFADLYLSQRTQSIRFGYEWHMFDANRWFMQPSIEGRRVREGQQKFLDLSIFQESGARLDSANNHYAFKFGPGLLMENTEQGPSDGGKNFAIFRSSLEITSHDYESYLTDPRQGYQLNILSSSILSGDQKPIRTHHFKITGTKLWNLLNYSPPKYVLGFRFGLETVISSQSQLRNQIPQHYFQ